MPTEQITVRTRYPDGAVVVRKAEAISINRNGVYAWPGPRDVEIQLVSFTLKSDQLTDGDGYDIDGIEIGDPQNAQIED